MPWHLKQGMLGVHDQLALESAYPGVFYGIVAGQKNLGYGRFVKSFYRLWHCQILF
jgi:hypothetical protein